MKEKYIHILGIVFTIIYGLFVIFVYTTEPRSLEEITIRAGETVDNFVNKGQILTGTYEIDKTKFNEGLQAFRADNFLLARDRFIAADPERRDANTQFYIAYSYYRQGWGRVSNDDELFTKGLAEVKRMQMLNPDFRSTDENLQIKTAVELQNEFEEGLRVTASDFNPLRVLRERK